VTVKTSSSSSATPLSLSAVGIGRGTVQVLTYSSNPLARALSNRSSLARAVAFLGVKILPNSDFAKLTISLCNLGGGEVLEWYDPVTRRLRPVTDQTTTVRDCANVTVLADGHHAPTIGDLVGTVFAVVHGKATTAVRAVKVPSSRGPKR
jgi:hypothetical protein